MIDHFRVTLATGKVTRETINLAAGEGNSLVDVVNIVSSTLSKEPNVTYHPSRVGEVTRYVADIGKARSLLGYNPTTRLGDTDLDLHQALRLRDASPGEGSVHLRLPHAVGEARASGRKAGAQRRGS